MLALLQRAELAVEVAYQEITVVGGCDATDRLARTCTLYIDQRPAFSSIANVAFSVIKASIDLLDIVIETSSILCRN
jgi:hypothetical protein